MQLMSCIDKSRVMATPDRPLPPPYNEASNTKPVTTVRWDSPEPELAWYRQQCCVFSIHQAVTFPLVEIVINDKAGTSCIGSPERLSNLLNEQIARPPRTRIRIRGSHYGSGKKKFGSQTDFDIWISADWLVASFPRIEVTCKGDQMIDEPVPFWADWLHEDYGRAKIILIERGVVSTIPDRLKAQITDCIRETNYSGSIDISIHVEHDKTLITRQEITSRTNSRYSPNTWPTSFSILRNRPKSDKVIEKLKEDMDEDICSFKVFWPHGEASTDPSAEGSGQQSQPQSQEPTKLEEAWFSAWRIPLQNAIIEMEEGFKHGTRRLTSKDQNDADVIGLRRRPPQKSWGGSLFSVRGSKMFRK